MRGGFRVHKSFADVISALSTTVTDALRVYEKKKNTLIGRALLSSPARRRNCRFRAAGEVVVVVVRG